jgi:hypothetical protein
MSSHRMGPKTLRLSGRLERKLPISRKSSCSLPLRSHQSGWCASGRTARQALRDINEKSIVHVSRRESPLGGREVGWDHVRGAWANIAQLATEGNVSLEDQLIQVVGEVAYEVSRVSSRWGITRSPSRGASRTSPSARPARGRSSITTRIWLRRRWTCSPDCNWRQGRLGGSLVFARYMHQGLVNAACDLPQASRVKGLQGSTFPFT